MSDMRTYRICQACGKGVRYITYDRKPDEIEYCPFCGVKQIPELIHQLLIA